MDEDLFSSQLQITLQRTENLSNYHAKIATLERHFQNMPIFNDVLENDSLIIIDFFTPDALLLISILKDLNKNQKPLHGVFDTAV
jgi:hypothetical protein